MYFIKEKLGFNNIQCILYIVFCNMGVYLQLLAVPSTG